MGGKITKFISFLITSSPIWLTKVSFYFLASNHITCYLPVFSHLSHIMRRLLVPSQITELVLHPWARWRGRGFMLIYLLCCSTADVFLIVDWGMLFARSQTGFAQLSCPGRFSRRRGVSHCHQSLPYWSQYAPLPCIRDTLGQGCSRSLADESLFLPASSSSQAFHCWALNLVYPEDKLSVLCEIMWLTVKVNVGNDRQQIWVFFCCIWSTSLCLLS